MATLYLRKSALYSNLQKLRRKNPNILPVIKDNAYGHGLIPIAKLLREFGVKRVVVRDNREGEAILPLFEEILVLYPHTGMGYRNLSYAINSLEQLRKNRHPNIHLKIDIGMHRNGIAVEEVGEALELVKKKGLNLKGVFGHFCCADEPVEVDTFIQLERFKRIREEVLKFVEREGWPKPYFHLANSAGVEKLPPEELMDYIRPGIALYGGMEGYEPVAKLVAKPILTRKLKAGEGVGYNKAFIAPREIEITLVDVGYGDGLPYFTESVQFRDGRTIGKISMDSVAVEGRLEKEVVVFDDIKEFAKNFNTITYDLLVKLSPRIKRVVVE